MVDFETGKVYNRQSEIHAIYMDSHKTEYQPIDI